MRMTKLEEKNLMSRLVHSPDLQYNDSSLKRILGKWRGKSRKLTVLLGGKKGCSPFKWKLHFSFIRKCVLSCNIRRDSSILIKAVLSWYWISSFSQHFEICQFQPHPLKKFSQFGCRPFRLVLELILILGRLVKDSWKFMMT